MSVTTLAHYQNRRASRVHQCMGCRGLIAVGDHYSDQRLACDGAAYTFREHALCRALYEHAYWRDGLYDDEGYEPADDDLPEWWRAFVTTFGPGAP